MITQVSYLNPRQESFPDSGIPRHNVEIISETQIRSLPAGFLNQSEYIQIGWKVKLMGGGGGIGRSASGVCAVILDEEQSCA
jgi:hypothetical protein